jgi:hypothetical protein
MKGEAKLQRKSVIIWGVFACSQSYKILLQAPQVGKEVIQSKVTPDLGMLLKPMARKFMTVLRL